MAIVEALEANGARRLRIKNPLSGEAIDAIEVTSKAEVGAAVKRAREAQPAWAALGVAERKRIVHRALDVLMSRQEEVIATVRAETGKTRVDALSIEIISSCDFINYWCGRAQKDLADEKVGLHGFLKPLKKLRVVYEPLGVVGVITPWNGPFVLSTDPTVQALLAGNAVLLKPSEVTPRAGEWAARILWEAGVPRDVLQVLHGDGETGAALVQAGVDKIAFTGSVRTGKKIAAACAEQLLPFTLELGGKDPMIVCADANLERAANGAVFLSMFNTGQVCLGVERVYVVERVADEFLKLVEEKVRAVRVGPGDDKEIGSVFWDRQLEIIERHVDDAVSQGARLLVGGRRTGDGLCYAPTLLTNVTHDMAVMREETFGPVLCVMVVPDEEAAIAAANDSDYGLSASVFTTDEEKAIRIARRLRAGSVMQNDAAVIYGIPEAPFGGLKSSGLGQVHGGSRALRGFCHAKPIVLDRWKLDKEEIWYPLTERTTKSLEKTIEFAFGKVLRRLMQ
ncbi:MAG: aldehyde dehydrogenase family protein [Myxococcales bacterium]|nr:aldehyde dehydrogenase family protein [Myxococcales bacterium]